MVYCAVVVCGLVLLIVPEFSKGQTSLFEGCKCKLSGSGYTAICRLITDCPSALHRLKSKKEKPQNCGFRGFTEIVCCEDDIIIDGTKPQNTTTEIPETNTGRRAMSRRKSEIACEEYSSSKCPEIVVPLIENGEDAALGEFRHMALLGYEGAFDVSWDCGGTLISDQHVLTAAHCAYNSQGKSPVVIRMGDLDVTTETDGATPLELRVADITPHPEYDPPKSYHDLAILKLTEKVTWNRNIYPACLHRENEIPEETLLATGWGQTSFFGQKSNILQKVKLEHVPLNQCNESYSSRLGKELPNGIHSQMLCAGDPEGVRDACLGDSGGPLQYRLPNSRCSYSIVGVISSGAGCASSLPGIYIRVSEYLDWIESVVWP